MAYVAFCAASGYSLFIFYTSSYPLPGCYPSYIFLYMETIQFSTGPSILFGGISIPCTCRITVSLDTHSPGQASFICIEPWYGRCDRAGFEGSLEEREYGNKLETGEVFERSYTIEVEI